MKTLFRFGLNGLNKLSFAYIGDYMFVLPYAKEILAFMAALMGIYWFFIIPINTDITSDKGEITHICMGFMCIFLGVLAYTFV